MRLAPSDVEAMYSRARPTLLEAAWNQQIWGPPVAVPTASERLIECFSIAAGPILLIAGYVFLFRFLLGS